MANRNPYDRDEIIDDGNTVHLPGGLPDDPNQSFVTDDIQLPDEVRLKDDRYIDPDHAEDVLGTIPGSPPLTEEQAAAILLGDSRPPTRPFRPFLESGFVPGGDFDNLDGTEPPDVILDDELGEQPVDNNHIVPPPTRTPPLGGWDTE